MEYISRTQYPYADGFCRIRKTDCLSWKHCKRLWRKEQVRSRTQILPWKDLFSLLYSFNSLWFLFHIWTEAYDKLQADLLKANESLTKILTSKDVKATVSTWRYTRSLHHSIYCSWIVLLKSFYCSLVIMQLLEMVERNELNRPLLTLLDENIVSAQQDGQVWDFLKFHLILHLKYVVALFCIDIMYVVHTSWCCIKYNQNRRKE